MAKGMTKSEMHRVGPLSGGPWRLGARGVLGMGRRGGRGVSRGRCACLEVHSGPQPTGLLTPGAHPTAWGMYIRY